MISYLGLKLQKLFLKIADSWAINGYLTLPGSNYYASVWKYTNDDDEIIRKPLNRLLFL
jgi:hypothetical protein